MNVYLRILSVLYMTGALLHLADLLDLRLEFSTLPVIWQTWIVFLLVMDTAASVGLWFRRRWGVAVFLVVALSQLVAYIGFDDYFGKQNALVAFHVATVTIYLFLRSRKAAVHSSKSKAK